MIPLHLLVISNLLYSMKKIKKHHTDPIPDIQNPYLDMVSPVSKAESTLSVGKYHPNGRVITCVDLRIRRKTLHESRSSSQLGPKQQSRNQKGLDNSYSNKSRSCL